MENLFFYIFGITAVASGLMIVLSRNPVHSALYLIVTLFCIAGLFALLSAHFLAVIQILVYAGAIMVLFLFVIMLLNLKKMENEFRNMFWFKFLGIGAVTMLVCEVVYLIAGGSSMGMPGGASSEMLLREGNTRLVGKLLFTDFLLPFEVTTVLLLVAIIGVVVLAKKHFEE